MQPSQPTMDGGNGMSGRLAVLDESLHVPNRDFCYWFGDPGKEVLQVVGAVDEYAAVRSFPPQPFLELFDFW